MTKRTGMKVDFVAVFADITRRNFHLHSWYDSNKNSNVRDTKKRGHEMCNIYRLSEYIGNKGYEETNKAAKQA